MRIFHLDPFYGARGLKIKLSVSAIPENGYTMLPDGASNGFIQPA